MSKKKDMTPYNDYIIQRFCYENATDESIAHEITEKGFYVAESRICTYRKEQGIIRLHKDEKWMLEQFINSKNNASEVARKIGCNPSTIRKRWVKMGLDTFTPRNQYFVNNIFSTYSHVSCYWAGYINADGHIEKYCGYGRNVPNYKLRIQISSKDATHLSLFSLTLVNNDKTADKYIKLKRTQKIYHLKEFRIANKQLCLDLIDKFDIIPAFKSTIERPPLNIPNQFISDYIRGYFDGDGCIYRNPVVGKNGTITIVGSIYVCNFIKDALSTHYQKAIGKIDKESGNGNLYYFKIYKKSHIKMFYSYIYQNDGPYLKRKHDKIRSVFA